MAAGSFWDQGCAVLLFFFLLLEFKRAVKRLCYLNILNGKNTCLNVYYRPTESRLNVGGGESLSYKFRLCFWGQSFVYVSLSVKILPLLLWFLLYWNNFYASGKKYSWKATEWQFVIPLNPISKLFLQSFFSVLFHPFYWGKLGLLQLHLKGKLPDPGGLFVTSVSFPEEYKVNSYSSYSSSTMSTP